MLKPSLAPLIAQTMSLPRPAGSGSLKLTPLAAPVPSLFTVTVKLAVPPALTVGVLVVLVMSTSGAVTSIVAVEWSFCSEGGSLPALTVAVLVRVAMKLVGSASAALITPVMCTAMVCPADSVLTPLRVSVWLGAVPLIWKSAGTKLPVFVPVSICQLMSLPRPGGKGSLRVTPVAVSSPSLVMLTVKPAVSPALTVGASAVLKTSTSTWWKV